MAEASLFLFVENSYLLLLCGLEKWSTSCVQHRGHNVGDTQLLPQGDVDKDDHVHDLQPLLQGALASKLFNTTQGKPKWCAYTIYFSRLLYWVEYPEQAWLVMVWAIYIYTYKVLVLRCGRLICSSTPNTIRTRQTCMVWGSRTSVCQYCGP